MSEIVLSEEAVWCLRRYCLDRETGQLTSNFSPRFSRREA